MRRVVLVGLCVLLLGYGIFEARRLIQGPTITIESPAQGSAISTSALTVVGFARNISFLTINNKPAFTDESGRFTFTFSPPPGYNTVTVEAKDRFGRSARKTVSVQLLDFCPRV
jgi:hypothetical protein